MQAGRIHRWLSWGLVAVLLAGGMLAYRIARSPAGTLLVAEQGAEWIRIDSQPSVVARHTTRNIAFFRHTFSTPRDLPTAEVTIKAFRSYRVVINDREVSSKGPEESPWVHAGRVDLRPHLRPGTNTLIIAVENRSGHPVLLAYSDDLDFRTDARWPVSTDARSWRVAALAAVRKPFPVSGSFPGTVTSLASAWPLIAGLFLVGSLLGQFCDRHRVTVAVFGHAIWEPKRFRSLLMGAWVLLCANNILRIPIEVGFDVLSHYDYVRYLVEQKSIPLANEGWQFFQGPLFYLLCVPLYLLFSAVFSGDAALQLIRVVPMACGLVQIEMVYRTLTLVFPGETRLINLGTAIGGFLPMGIYISQIVGNEPLLGCLTAIVVYLCLRLLVDDESALNKRALVLGLVFGLALLTKVTIVLLLPVVLGIVVLRAVGIQRRSLGSLQPALWFVASASVVAGWYYLRNWVRLGKPFIGGWDSARGFFWWQDPSYRLPENFYSFGASLVQPVYSSLYGFWDGLYSTLWLDGYLSSMIAVEYAPRWNYELMIALSPVALPMCLLAAVGCWQGFRPQSRESLGKHVLTALLCISIYWAAMLFLYIKVPTYSTVKATYTLGLIPCYVLLITSGLKAASGNRLVESVLTGYVCAWVAMSYCAFFVIR